MALLELGFRFDEIPDYDIRLDPDTGGGSLGVGGTLLGLKEAKPLPASD